MEEFLYSNSNFSVSLIDIHCLLLFNGKYFRNFSIFRHFFANFVDESNVFTNIVLFTFNVCINTSSHSLGLPAHSDVEHFFPLDQNSNLIPNCSRGTGESKGVKRRIIAEHTLSCFRSIHNFSYYQSLSSGAR